MAHPVPIQVDYRVCYGTEGPQLLDCPGCVAAHFAELLILQAPDAPGVENATRHML